jgi:hypothetical protein
LDVINWPLKQNNSAHFLVYWKLGENDLEAILSFEDLKYLLFKVQEFERATAFLIRILVKCNFNEQPTLEKNP